MKQTLLMLALSLSTMGAPRAWSEPAITPAPLPEENPGASVVARIPVRHAPANAMARWLTQSQPPPLPDGLSFRPFEKLAQDASASEDGREVSVLTKPEHIDRLRQIVAFLDRPLQRIEFTAQSVVIDKADLPLLLPGQPANKLQPGLFPQIVPVPDNTYKDTLKRLSGERRVLEMQGHSDTVTANDAAWLSSGGLPSENLFVAYVTPALQKDGIRCALMMGWPKTVSHQQIELRNGQTMAIFLWDYHKPASQVTLTFLTPRIIPGADKKK